MAMKKLIAAAVPLALLPITAQGATVEQLERQVQSLNQRLSAQEQRFRVNGFATFGAVQSDVEESTDTYHRGINNETNFRRYTKAGIQMSFNMDPQTAVVTQLVARGENDFAVKAEWAYFKHQLSNNLAMKLGRLRKPNYLLSEYFDVGYAMPWTNAPVEVYGVLEATANYEAIDLSYDMDMGDWTSNIQVQYGRAVSTETISEDLVAFNYTMTDGLLTLRAGYSQADVAIVAGSDTAGTASTLNGVLANTDKSSEQAGASLKGTFAGLAVMYDDGDILGIAEYTTLSVESLFADQDGYYAMGGYRFGQWMPYLTYAHEETTDDDVRDATITNPLLSPTNPDDANGNGVSDSYELVAGGIIAMQSLNKEQTRTALGVRYDYKPGVALKLQYDMIDVGDTAGEFDAAPSEDSANVISFTIDTVF